VRRREAEEIAMDEVGIERVRVFGLALVFLVVAVGAAWLSVAVFSGRFAASPAAESAGTSVTNASQPGPGLSPASPAGHGRSPFRVVFGILCAAVSLALAAFSYALLRVGAGPAKRLLPNRTL
jgi:hypothetical protein